MKHSYLALVIASVLSTAVLVGCDKKEDADPAAAQQQMPPAVVNVQTVTFRRRTASTDVLWSYDSFSNC